MEPLPDLTTLTDDDLRVMIRELEQEEDEVSFRRRVLHGRIDILRAEHVARLREQVSAGEAKLADVERLSEILAGKARLRDDMRNPTRPLLRALPVAGQGAREPRLLPGVRLPEPGGRQLLLALRRAARRRDGPETTMTFDVDEAGEEGESLLDDARDHRPGARRALGRRDGGPAVPAGDGRTLIGRSPECDIFLDDVTVSRRHAEITREGDTFTIRDLGSLNGTYVNRQRIESTVLEDDDEVQIGKYRLTFLQR